MGLVRNDVPKQGFVPVAAEGRLEVNGHLVGSVDSLDGRDHNAVAERGASEEALNPPRLPMGSTLGGQITTQDHIAGQDYLVLVIKMGKGVVALTPLRTDLAQPVTEERQVSVSRSDAIARNWFVFEEPLRTCLEEKAVSTFKLLDTKGSNVWARIEIRYEIGSKLYNVVGVNTPAIFTHREASIDYSSLIACEAFAGAEHAIFDVLLSSKRTQLGRPDTTTIATAYDEMSPIFDDVITTQDTYHDMYKMYIETFDFTGTVLDLACGTGMFARCLRKASVAANLSGVDISSASIALAQQYYDEPIVLGDMYTEIMKAGQYDHISCYGAMHFFDDVDFTAILVRMLMCARRSVSFEVDDLSKEYLDRINACEGPGWRNFNNKAALRDFGVPRGWTKVLERSAKLYRSPATGLEVGCIQVRFERNAELAPQNTISIWGKPE